MLLRQNLLFDLLDLAAEGLVGLKEVRNGLARVEHRGVVAPSDGGADGRERGFGVLLGQVHGDLPGLGDLARALRGVEACEVEVQVVAHHLDDVVDGDLLLVELDVDLQNLLRQRRGDLAPEERGVGHKRRDGTLDLTHVGRDVVGQVGDDLVGDLGSEFAGLGADDLDLRLVVRRVELRRESPLEAGEQALLDVLQLYGRLVRGEDQLLARQLEVVEDVEEGILRAGLSRQLLDVVDNQHVDHLVEVDEVGNLAVLVCRLELCLELVHRDVEHLQLGVALAHLVADRLHDVGLAESRVPVYI